MYVNKTRRALALLLIAALLTALSGCAALGIGGEKDAISAEAAPVETPEPSRVSTTAVTLDLSGMELTEAEIATLPQCSALTALDVRGSNLSPEQIKRVIAALPNCAVRWNVPFGGLSVDSETTEITADNTVDAAALGEALLYLPRLTRVDLYAAAISTQDALALTERYPAVRFLMNADVCGVPADTAATALDLSNASGFDAETLVSALRLFPDMESVDLGAQTLSTADMDALTNAYPEIQFNWSLTYQGVTVSSGDEELDLSGKPITNVDELVEMLRYLPGLKRLDLSDCGLSNEQLGALREQFPNMAIHWTITVGRWTMRTDATAFSTGQEHTTKQVKYDKKGGSKVLKTEDIQPLQYCTEMVALDIGHQKIDDISVVSNMKKLRFLIIADGKFTDITPIAACTELEFLEVFQNYIADFSPLLSLTKLKCLNCGATKSPDKAAEDAAALERLAVLKQLTGLERLWCIHAGFDKGQVAELQAALPDCKIASGGAHPTASGWRTNNAYYVEMQGLFELKVLD